MNLIVCLAFAVVFSIDVCRAQTGIDDDTNGAIGFFAPALSGAIATVQSQVEPSVASLDNVDTTSPTPEPSTTSSTTSPTSTTPSTTSSHSSTKSSSSTSSTAKASSSTTQSASASATAAPSHHPNAKIGVGVGVPLGISFLAAICFLMYRHRRHKEISRLQHHGIIAAAGLYPVNEESNDGVGGTDQRRATDIENGSDSQVNEKDDVHEISGTEIPHHARELIGSPGVPRQELGMRRDTE